MIAWIPGLRVILPHAVAQIFRITDVDNAPRRILHEIDAGGARKALNLLTYIHGASPGQRCRKVLSWIIAVQELFLNAYCDKGARIEQGSESVHGLFVPWPRRLSQAKLRPQE